MEDYILREIDRLGEMLLLIARKLGLLDGDKPNYSLTNVKDEFGMAYFGSRSCLLLAQVRKKGWDLRHCRA
jgi:hypothetical protein